MHPIPRGHPTHPGADPAARGPWQVSWEVRRGQEEQQRLGSYGKQAYPETRCAGGAAEVGREAWSPLPHSVGCAPAGTCRSACLPSLGKQSRPAPQLTQSPFLSTSMPERLSLTPGSPNRTFLEGLGKKQNFLFSQSLMRQSRPRQRPPTITKPPGLLPHTSVLKSKSLQHAGLTHTCWWSPHCRQGPEEWSAGSQDADYCP